MPENTTHAAVQPVLYSWLITLQFRIGGGFGVLTTEGTIPITPGASRTRAYRNIRAELTLQNPDLEQANVLFFSLDPDRL
ncbi:hypothetical protein BX265_1836 [Streptomyces sp. TLI_235]|nr:hypothetical protein [Streptomyces sp. TLI_235]PBC77099.1 hypothetical protein BX265_1836 [Streptomyces sp. TLI_235]